MSNVYQVVYSGSSNLISYRTLSLLSLCFKIRQRVKTLWQRNLLLFLLEVWLICSNKIQLGVTVICSLKVIKIKFLKTLSASFEFQTPQVRTISWFLLKAFNFRRSGSAHSNEGQTVTSYIQTTL